MYRILAISGLAVVLAASAIAQIPTKGDAFFGYSYANVDTLSFVNGNRMGTNGWEASLEGKFLPWVGIVADFDGHYGSQSLSLVCPGDPLIPCGSTNVSVHQEDVLFGPRVSVSVGKYQPFFEALLGVGHVNTNVLSSDTSFATAIGGGLDYRLLRPIAWRVQADYVQTRFFGTTQNNVRISTGIVLRF